jgi:alpha-glucosidase
MRTQARKAVATLVPAAAPWWKEGVIYQIYPRSFADSNGDGVGDLPGITSRLDYLVDLGVDAIWLSPIYPSPMKDFGYDVSDYCAVDPVFGTLDDFDTLLEQAHRRGIRVILDMVMNHTSDQHPWFLESRASVQSPKRDWYFWRKGRSVGRPPNNWAAAFGGSAWERDALTGEYYLHLFDRSQPDLNWRNPDVKRAMIDVWRFWLERGVDGFRLDVAHMLMKHPELPDNPFRLGLRDYDRQLHGNHENLAETHGLWKELRRVLDEYPDRMLVGEVHWRGEGAEAYYGDGTDELNLTFNFAMMFARYRAGTFRRAVEDWERRLPPDAWPCWVLSNHDNRRHISRWANRPERARLTAMFLLTIRGTPFLYYGEEIGMQEAFIPRRELRDPPGVRYWPIYRGRDGCRTPMQWSSTPYAGFSSTHPWMRLGADAARNNVERQEADQGSLLNLYRHLIRLRRSTPALTRGTLRFLPERDRAVLGYLREHPEQTALVCLNFSARERVVDLVDEASGRWQIALSTISRPRTDVSGKLRLGPDEGAVLVRL